MVPEAQGHTGRRGAGRAGTPQPLNDGPRFPGEELRHSHEGLAVRIHRTFSTDISEAFLSKARPDIHRGHKVGGGIPPRAWEERHGRGRSLQLPHSGEEACPHHQRCSD